jgi:hypothetical protein
VPSTKHKDRKYIRNNEKKEKIKDKHRKKKSEGMKQKCTVQSIKAFVQKTFIFKFKKKVPIWNLNFLDDVYKHNFLNLYRTVVKTKNRLFLEKL